MSESPTKIISSHGAHNCLQSGSRRIPRLSSTSRRAPHTTASPYSLVTPSVSRNKDANSNGNGSISRFSTSARATSSAGPYRSASGYISTINSRHTHTIITGHGKTRKIADDKPPNPHPQDSHHPRSHQQSQWNPHHRNEQGPHPCPPHPTAPPPRPTSAS